MDEFKYNLVIPLMGKGSRMKAGGYDTTKCLMKIGDKTNLEWGLDSIDKTECRLIFITRLDQPEVKKFISQKYPNAVVIVKDGETTGSLHTVTMAFDYINNDIPLIVFNPDVSFTLYKPEPKDFEDGLILTFKSNNINYSYVQEKDGYVIRTAEKEVISNYATCGLYCFKSGKMLLDNFPYAPKRNGETYVCPFYNQLIDVGFKFKTKEVDNFYVFGTPEEYEFVKNYLLPHMGTKKVVLASCHSGFDTKETLKRMLIERKIEVVDCGPDCDDSCDYIDYTVKAADYIRRGYIGIVACRSGQGVNIAMNKEHGVISALIDGDETKLHHKIKETIRHNFTNCFSFPDLKTYNNIYLNMCLDAILKTVPEGGRHQNRIMGVMKNDLRRINK